MLQSLDYALIGVVANKRQGLDFGRQVLKAFNIMGVVENISSIYQFKPKNLEINVKGELGMTHLAFCVLLQLKDVEDWGQDFGRQVQKFAEKVASVVDIKTYEVQILDFRSQFTMCESAVLPYPEWLEREEFLFTSLEVLPQDYIHPVLKKPLHESLNHEQEAWPDSAFLKSGKTLLD